MFTLSKDQSKLIAKAKEDLSEKHASTISAFNDISYNPARIDSSLNRAEISKIINNIFSSGIRKLEESNVIDIPSMETKFNVDKEKYEILYKKIDEELLKDKRVPIDFIDAYRIILAREKYQYISMLINSIDLSERYDMTNQLLDKIRFSCSSRITSCDAQLKSVYLGDIFDLDKKDEIMKKKREGQAVIDEIDKIIASNNMSRSGYIKNGKSFEEEPEEEVIVTYSRDPGSVRRR